MNGVVIGITAASIAWALLVCAAALFADWLEMRRVCKAAKVITETIMKGRSRDDE